MYTRSRWPIAFVLTTVVLLVMTSYGAVRGQTSQRCFAETNFCIGGRIREFWEQNGGLSVFGFPVTPQQEGSD